MMKINIFKIALIFSVAVFFNSCDEEQIIYNPPGSSFAQVDFSTGEIVENSDEAIITTIQLGRPNTSGVTINYSISGDISRFQVVSPSESSVSIPAGQTSAEIVIMPVDNFDVDGSAEAIITLLDTSSVPVGIAGEGNELVSRTITIIDNDCPIDIDSFVGTYDVFENFTAGNNSPLGLNNFFGESYQMEIALLPGDITGTKVVLTNSAGFDEYIADGTVMSFDTCNTRITFDDGFPTVALFRTYEFTASSYDEADNIIQATGPLATFGEYQFTFTKQ